MFCVKCGTRLPDDALFCIKCGKAVEEEIRKEFSEELSNSRPAVSANSSIPIGNQTISESESDNLNLHCSQCGFIGQMRIVERPYIRKKAIIYVVGYGTLIIIGLLLDKILVPILPWVVLFFGGSILVGISIGFIRALANFVPSDIWVMCPQCKQKLIYRQKKPL